MRTKTATVEVEVCGHCPHYDNSIGAGCTMTGREVNQWADPDWCPLPTAAAGSHIQEIVDTRDVQQKVRK